LRFTNCIERFNFSQIFHALIFFKNVYLFKILSILDFRNERVNTNTLDHRTELMDVKFYDKPKLDKPTMIAAWPGMGYLAKISADYIRRKIKAKLIAEIKYYHNVLIYNEGLAELAPIQHKIFASEEKNLLICVGDAQPSTPEDSLRLAKKIAEIAKDLDVELICTMAAYPNEYYSEPKVYGVYTNENLKKRLETACVQILQDEGAINGLNGVMIGVAKHLGMNGLCLLGDINYANFPQHISSKAVLQKIDKILNLELDMEQVNNRAKKIESSIKKRLNIYEEKDNEYLIPEEKRFGYIS
jgi:proteasome assembly chaperone (PAC2) family protein